MRNIYFLIYIFLFSACELKETSFYNNDSTADSTIVFMDHSVNNSEFKINSFNDLKNLENEKKCYFSLTQNAFSHHQYIYAYDLVFNQSFMQFNGEMISFTTEYSTFADDSLRIYAHNDSIQLEIQSVMIDSVETMNYAGEISVSIHGENQFKSIVIGACDN